MDMYGGGQGPYCTVWMDESRRGVVNRQGVSAERRHSALSRNSLAQSLTEPHRASQGEPACEGK